VIPVRNEVADEEVEKRVEHAIDGWRDMQVLRFRSDDI
jgi:hypothetical protein